MAFNNLIDDCIVLRLFSPEDQIRLVDTDNRSVRRDRNNVELIDLTELVLFSHCRTGHTGKLLVKTEVVLECDSSKRLGFMLDLDAFLCLDRLMQTVIITSAHHHTAGVLIDNDDLIVLDNIVRIQMHDTVRLDCLVNMVQERHILHIHEVFNMEIALCLLDAAAGNRRGFRLFVDDVVSVLVCLVLVFLIIGLNNRDRGQGAGKAICLLIKLCGFVTAAGNDQRCSRLVDQDRVNLVNDRKVRGALHTVLLVNDHVVAQIIKAHLIVGAVGNVTGVCRTALVIVQVMDDASDSQAEETENLAHFIGLCLCQVVVNRNDMDAVTGETVQIGCNAGNQRFTFTGTHFRDSALMQNDCTDNLDRERLFAENTVRSLADSCKGFHHNIIKRLAVRKALTEFNSLCLQSSIGKTFVFLIEIKHLFLDRFDFCKFFFAVGSEDPVNKAH